MANSEKKAMVVDQQEHNQFDGLPDEVLRLILNKISDPKSLLRCSLISKRFASILSKTQTLSLQITAQIPLPTPIPPDGRNLNSSNPNNNHLYTSFLTTPFRLLHQILDPMLPPSPWEMESAEALLRLLTKLLRRFDRIRSLRVEVPCSCHYNIPFRSGSSGHDDGQVFKWKAKFGPKIKTFSFISPTLVRQIDDDVGEGGQESEPPAVDWFNHGHGKTFWPVFYAFSMHRALLLLIVQHPNLNSVEITDSMKQGKLGLEGEELVELRNVLNSWSKLLECVDLIELPHHMKVWYVPELRLRLSRVVMEGVTLVVFRGRDAESIYGGEDNDGDDDEEDLDYDAVLAGGFEDDGDGIFGEALTQILTNHKDKLKLSR